MKYSTLALATLFFCLLGNAEAKYLMKSGYEPRAYTYDGGFFTDKYKPVYVKGFAQDNSAFYFTDMMDQIALDKKNSQWKIEESPPGICRLRPRSLNSPDRPEFFTEQNGELRRWLFRSKKDWLQFACVEVD